MKRAISLAVLGSVVLLAMALAGASSAARPHDGPAGATTAASSKVRALGPGFVRQVGLRNYAGPNCPGSGWNCTGSTRVLQAATPGGQNVAECTGSLVMNPCVIMQGPSAQNTARCTQKSTAVSATQSCTITQTGGSNIAYVTQVISQDAGSDQYGSQAAIVTQTGSVLNQLQLSQDASQSEKTGATQLQNAYQSAVVTQTASGTGNNVSSIYQSQLQKEYARSTTQKQNDGTGTGLGDCFAGTPTKPNACANVTQESGAGTNSNHLKQFVNEDMNSTGPATQLQGSAEGGLDGRVHQKTDSGSSTNEVKQSKAFNETVPKGSSSSQTQSDPMRCCGSFSQLGGTGNSETISQSSTLSASEPGANQSSTLIGESNTPVGSCSITQKASVNNDSATNFYSQPTSCPTVTLVTQCTSGGDCTAEAPMVGVPESSLSLCVQNISVSDPDCTASTVGDSFNTLQYTVTYTNAGDGAAHNVVVTAPIPGQTGPPVNLDCTSAGSCQVDFVAGSPVGITWNIGTAAAGTTLSATFTVDVINGGCGTRTIHATVDTAEEPPVDSGDASVGLPGCIS